MAEVSERQQRYTLGEVAGEQDYLAGLPHREDVCGDFGRGYRDGYEDAQERDTDGHTHWQQGEECESVYRCPYCGEQASDDNTSSDGEALRCPDCGLRVEYFDALG